MNLKVSGQMHLRLKMMAAFWRTANLERLAAGDADEDSEALPDFPALIVHEAIRRYVDLVGLDPPHRSSAEWDRRLAIMRDALPSRLQLPGSERN